MKYAFYLVTFMVAQVCVAGAVAAFVAKHTIDQYDHSTTPETVVVKELPGPKAEARPATANVGQMLFENERPLVPAGWKAGWAERIGRANCTPLVGPNGEEVVAVEFDGGVGHEDAEKEISAGLLAGGWRNEGGSGGSYWRGGKTAVVERLWDRNRNTYVVAKGKDHRTATEAAKSFLKK